MISVNTKKVLFIIVLAATVIWFSCKKSNTQITDSDWQVESIKVHVDSAVRFANSGQIYVLSFEGEKNYNFRLDVNICGGDVNFKRGAHNIAFGLAACTEACCDSDFAQKAVSLLQEVSKYELSGNRLILFADDSRKIDLIKK
jgi:heat shock protein HslJ